MAVVTSMALGLDGLPLGAAHLAHPPLRFLHQGRVVVLAGLALVAFDLLRGEAFVEFLVCQGHVILR